jgi:antitoxin HicB
MGVRDRKGINRALNDIRRELLGGGVALEVHGINGQCETEAVVTARQYHYTVLFEPAEEGGYTVTCPSLPGLVTEGDTLEEARAMAAEAIRGYLEALAKDGLPLPPEDPEPEDKIIKETVAVAIEEV